MEAETDVATGFLSNIIASLWDAWYSFRQVPGWWLTDECTFAANYVAHVFVMGVAAGLLVSLGLKFSLRAK